ncbi:MAG: type VI secretion system tube protein Hcp [Acidobacteriaceae bacterium]|nr:type VI secretion system tube protein Hcp [Acidobacteriaceae bacterium]
MAFDAFMYFTGGDPAVQGETTDSTYTSKKAFEIYSFSWGASNPVTVGSGTTGMGAGKVSLSSFNIMKRTDNASPTLFKACCTGTHYPSASVVLRKSGGKAVDYIQYDFNEVMVESIQWSGSSGGDDTPTESVSFAYGEVTINYTPQTKDGTLGTKNSAKWNQTTNKSE